ncbi:MAG: RodZ domain-containing protein [Gammaproteobacteria bacterium]
MNESGQVTQDEPAVSIGETLKNLREERNLSVTEIAGRLHLDPRIIELLERDAFEDLPAGIFVRGYIRNYAKQLEVDPERLIEIYDETGGEEEPEIIPEVKHPRQTSSSDKPVKAFTYLLTLILVILLIAWWQSNFLITDITDKAFPDKSDRGQPPAFDYPFEVVKHPDIQYYEKPPPIEIEPRAETETANQSAGLSTQEAVTDSASETITRSANGPDEVIMRLSADSWIEVRDADGREIYVNLARAGETLVLRGRAPFSVLLGFAQGVEITFNGKEFDSASHSRSGVARFTLGE